MITPIRVAVIREGKVPPDARAALTPTQAAEVSAMPGFGLTVQPSEGRTFDDSAYAKTGVALTEKLDDRDVLLGVKEVPVDQLLEDKTYFFFSHTHKQQAYNRGLLQEVLRKRIRLIDYELLTDDAGKRLIAFGRFAGMVGAHHALSAWGVRTGSYDLPAMVEIEDYEAAKRAYDDIDFGQVKIVVTGTGRVGKGACEVLEAAGLARVTPEVFLNSNPKGGIYTNIGVRNYVRRKDGSPVQQKVFYEQPGLFESAFVRFTKAADVLVHGIFWDNRAPAMFTLEDVASPDWRIQVIADVTCDIAPVTSIPATLRASTIANPYFGFHRKEHREIDAWHKDGITMMTVDNLPNEMPREASETFGDMFLRRILPELKKDHSAILERATIARNGSLTDAFNYLQAFVDEA